MDHQRHERMMDILGEAIELPTEQRGAYVAKACGDDAELRAEVERLLGVEQQASRAFSDPRGARGWLKEITGQSNPVAVAPPNPSAEQPTLVGTTLGAYTFTQLLGAGGMGIVYRARDTRLDRSVAIKSLPPSVTADPSRLSRFSREARLLAGLSHPNVATVYGLEEGPSGKFLVMELVDGESLAQRITRGPLTVAESIDLGIQVAAGLAAAHDAGVVHRDVKPANIMVSPDGKVKVLDFGLAREVAGRVMDTSQAIAAAPTNITQEGSVIGTPRYMSPEQLRGQALDRRADVFAYGCVLFECLTGRPAFPGNTPADIVAAVLEREPDWFALPPRTPEPMVRVIKRCLVKDPAKRMRDLGDARIELEETQSARAATIDRAERPWLRKAVIGIVACAAIAVAGAAGFLLKPAAQDVKPQPPKVAAKRFAIPFPNNQPQNDLAHVRLTLARDGSRMAVSATDGTAQHVWVRGAMEPHFSKVEGTLDAWLPTLSPDGSWIAYFDGGSMRRRRVDGGNATQIVPISGYWGNYAWGGDGFITYAPLWNKGIARVPAAGGTPEYVSVPDYDKGEFSYVGPCVVDEDNAILYAVWDGRVGTRIDAFDLKAKAKHRIVVEDGTTPRVARTPRGTHLLYERAGTLYAAPFDTKSLKRTGPEKAIVDGVMIDRALFNACYDVADDGTLVYVAGPMFAEESRLSWVGKTGVATPINDDRMSFVEPRFSADGTKLSVLIKGDIYRPYVYDLKRGTSMRVILDADCISCCISPSGNELAYVSNKDGPYTLYVMNLADGKSRKIKVFTEDYSNGITWSPDGKTFIFAMSPKMDMARVNWTYDIETGAMRRVTTTTTKERSAEFSPDGKWIAYASEDTGTREVYVAGYPDLTQHRQITKGGGDWPRWAHDGKSLYFRAKGGLYSVPVTDGVVAGERTLVYGKPFGQSDYELPDYAVSPDGRLLIIEASERGPTVKEVSVILNWHAMLDQTSEMRSEAAK